MTAFDIHPQDRAEMEARARLLGCVYVAAVDYHRHGGFWRRIRLHRTMRRAHKHGVDLPAIAQAAQQARKETTP